MRHTTSLGVVGVVSALALDQTSKMIVVAYASTLSSGLPVLPGFNLVYHRNDGVTFGLLNATPWWGLVVLATIICVCLSVLLVKTKKRIEAIAYGLIIGGALGNVIDRIRMGGVTDFLDFSIGDLHWPAFNLADTAIFVGVAILITWPWMQKPKTAR
ncbi:MAG: signal peptidase II [Roseovarius sp.]|nr:signal peptidase II [Roseovarius sp.]